MTSPDALRSRTLSLLYQEVRRAEVTRKDAQQRLDYLRGLRIRMLGDRVLQAAAWKVANHLRWPDTLLAEDVASTQLQADALITLDEELAHAMKNLATIEPIHKLS